MGGLILREPRFPPALSPTILPKKCNALLIVVLFFCPVKWAFYTFGHLNRRISGDLSVTKATLPRTFSMSKGVNEKRCKSSNKLQSEVIGPRENAILHSCVGEWHMDTMFENRDAWIEGGLGHMLIIGKFRSDPCAMGEYSWMEYREPFDCIYEKYSEEQIANVKGCIRFVKK